MVEHGSRDCVTYAQTPWINDELQRVIRPLTIKELAARACPTYEQLETRDLHLAVPLPQTNQFRRVIRLQSNEKHQAQETNAESFMAPNSSPSRTQAGTLQEHVNDRIICHGKAKLTMIRSTHLPKFENSLTAGNDTDSTATTHSSPLDTSHSTKVSVITVTLNNRFRIISMKPKRDDHK